MIGDPFTCNYCGLATNKATESHGDSMAMVTNYRMAMRKLT